MNKFALIVCFVLLSAVFCQGENFGKYASIKELLETKSARGMYWTKGKFAGLQDLNNMVFFMKDGDNTIPVKLLKKDMDAGKRFRSMNLQDGDPIKIKGVLRSIPVGRGYQVGLDDAVFIGAYGKEEL